MNRSGCLLLFGPLLLTVLFPTIASACRPLSMNGMVVKQSAFGAVVAPSAVEADEAVASGEVAKLAAQKYFGIEIKAMLIAPPDYFPATTNLDCGIEFPWPFYGRSGSQKFSQYVMSHEIGHVIFIKYLVPSSGKLEYGGKAPDWLDEMAALAFEGSKGAEERQRFAVKLALNGALIPVKKLFSMTHPEWSEQEKQISPSVKLASSSETLSYYVTIRLLFDFLISKTEDEKIIRKMARRVFLGKDIDGWILRKTRVKSTQDLDNLLITHAKKYPFYSVSSARLN